MRERGADLSDVSVMVLDAGVPSGLAVIRSLGRSGASITAGWHRRAPMGWFSRFTRSRIVHADPQASSERFTADVTRALRAAPPDLVMATTDPTVWSLARMRQPRGELAADRVAIPELEQVEQALDKLRCLELAESLQIAVPPTVALETQSSEAARVARLGFPLVLKPRQSFAEARMGRLIGYGSARFIPDQRGLDDLLATANHAGIPFLAQPYIPGWGEGIFALCDRGRLIATFAHRRLREATPLGGPSVLAESVEPDQELLGHSRALLAALEWHGVAMVEFRREAGTGRALLMEINGRFWNSLQLAVRAGVDFPSLLARLHLGLPVIGPVRYRTGLRGHFLRGELARVRSVMGGPPRGWPHPYPGRLRAVRDLAAGVLSGSQGMVSDGSDPLPGVVYALQVLTGRVR